MSVSVEIDHSGLIREAVVSIISAHIEAMCAVKKVALVKGTAKTTAASIVGRWSGRAVLLVGTMARLPYGETYPSKASLAKALRWSVRPLSDCWKRLGDVKIPVRQAEGADDAQQWIEVFRLGRERRFSGDGIALYLGLNQPTYEAAMRIIKTTVDASESLRSNIDGARNSVEDNEDLDAEKRDAPRRFLAEREESIVRGPQLSLAVNGSK